MDAIVMGNEVKDNLLKTYHPTLSGFGTDPTNPERMYDDDGASITGTGTFTGTGNGGIITVDFGSPKNVAVYAYTSLITDTGTETLTLEFLVGASSWIKLQSVTNTASTLTGQAPLFGIIRTQSIRLRASNPASSTFGVAVKEFGIFEL